MTPQPAERPARPPRPLSRREQEFSDRVEARALKVLNSIARKSDTYDQFRFNLIEATRSDDDNPA